MIQENISLKFYDGKMRTVRVLLPEEYKNSEQTYPVLYMFDGQNLFDPEDSYTGVTWEVREALEQLQEEGKAGPMIVVGIDHAGPRRLHEYGPFRMKYKRRWIVGEGHRFGSFLVEELIPSLESRYPMQKDPAGRFLAGSSMGGLMTAYTIMTYPDVFSKAGIFSLCSWISKKEFTAYAAETIRPASNKFYIQAGAREGLDVTTGKENRRVSKNYLEDSLDFIRQLQSGGIMPEQITWRLGEQDWHSESCWQTYMPEFLQWLQR